MASCQTHYKLHIKSCLFLRKLIRKWRLVTSSVHPAIYRRWTVAQCCGWGAFEMHTTGAAEMKQTKSMALEKHLHRGWLLLCIKHNLKIWNTPLATWFEKTCLFNVAKTVFTVQSNWIHFLSGWTRWLTGRLRLASIVINCMINWYGWGFPSSARILGP